MSFHEKLAGKYYPGPSVVFLGNILLGILKLLLGFACGLHFVRRFYFKGTRKPNDGRVFHIASSNANLALFLFLTLFL